MDISVRNHVVRSVFEDGWNRQEFDSFAGYLGDEIVFNYRGDRVHTDLAGLKELVAMWRQAFPDLEFQILDVVGDNDLVAINLILTGTHRGDWMGVPATGRRIEVEEMMFFRFDGDKIVELWEVIDEHQMRRQLTAG